MSLILHLSDLHLLPRDLDEPAGDYGKLEILTSAERERKVSLIRSTLQQLARRFRGETLTAVVISGDITVANNEEGFKLLDGVLNELGDLRPANDRIVVVPGNHDVAWQRSPLDEDKPEERYRHFLDYVVNRGFITPLLDGVDFNEDTRADELSAGEHLVVDEKHRWVIIPVNSSHFCGRALKLDDAARRAWDEAARRAGMSVTELGRKLGTPLSYDIARVNPKQLGLIGAMATAALGGAGMEIEPGTGPLKIVVMHHHLLPVSPVEEFKPFESLSNLSNVRQFLRTNHVDLVLHGHKHAGTLYWDHIYPLGDNLSRPPHPVFVVAAPGAPSTPGQPLLRLIRLNERPRTHTLHVATIPAIQYGHQLEEPVEVPVRLWRPGAVEPAQDGLVLVEGRDFDTTYARLRSLFEGMAASEHLHNVVCWTGTPLPESRAPEGYPDVPNAESLEDWFNEMVEWWQQPVSRLDAAGYFTHGSRITGYRHGLQTVDQLDQAVKSIRKDPRSSRGVITLLTPTMTPPKQGGFPSFCQLHLFVREVGRGRFLEAVAYFRKQEMRYWWPINMAEVMRLQREVVEKLQNQTSFQGLQPGPVTTISAVALWSDAPPRVVIPKVDRLLDQDIHKLWSLSAALMWPEMPNRGELQQGWAEVLDGLVPPESWNEDGVPVATAGLEYLIDALNSLLRGNAGSAAGDIASLLRQVLVANEGYRDAPDQEQQHERWRNNVCTLVDQLRRKVDAVFVVPD